ncbi:hypothetical protein F4779DRAFT_578327 [Xylariaceae sp. FL0662B]|nr:hypothetical protein F4779DRAFT_578327 [Xylariaceae sp. FL0662B]
MDATRMRGGEWRMLNGKNAKGVLAIALVAWRPLYAAARYLHQYHSILMTSIYDGYRDRQVAKNAAHTIDVHTYTHHIDYGLELLALRLSFPFLQ